MRRLILTLKGCALRFLARHEEAIAHCRQACQIPDFGYMPHVNLAAALAEAGKKSEAQAAVENPYRSDRHFRSASSKAITSA